MRKLTTSDINATVGFPVKSGTLNHLQLAYQEALDALAQAIITRPQVGIVTKLFGCIDSTPIGVTRTISKGAIYYSGEIYLVDAVTLTEGVNVAVATIDDTSYVDGVKADTVKFTDNISRAVHRIRKVKISLAASGSGIENFSDFQVGLIQEYETITYGAPDFGSIGGATFSSGTCRYKIIGKIMHGQLRLAFIAGAGGAHNVTIKLPALKKFNSAIENHNLMFANEAGTKIVVDAEFDPASNKITLNKYNTNFADIGANDTFIFGQFTIEVD